MRSIAVCVLVVLTSIAGLASKGYARATEKTLYTFNGKANGGYPGDLVSDSLGNLYGMTQTGGNRATCNGLGCGIVFELSPTVAGKWTETILYEFAGGMDGRYPQGGMVFDADGNLYGMTNNGGTFDSGIIFELSPGTEGPWKETILYTFTGGADGGRPAGELIFDSAGNLYGTAGFGGDLTCPIQHPIGCGIIFRLTPNVGNSILTVLYAFHGHEGAYPSKLAMDATGNLFGTTNSGGSSSICRYGCGVVFELAPLADGSWNYSVLHAFSGGRDGGTPDAGVVLDATGNLYGTASIGGNPACFTFGCGLVFELSPVSGGRWKENVLHSFNGGTDGSFILPGVVLDPEGNLYGVTYVGGLISDECPSGCGRVYELSRTSDGKWKETNLYGFKGGADGVNPYSGLLRDASGHLFGSAFGGAPNASEVFQITP